MIALIIITTFLVDETMDNIREVAKKLLHREFMAVLRADYENTKQDKYTTIGLWNTKQLNSKLRSELTKGSQITSLCKELQVTSRFSRALFQNAFFQNNEHKKIKC